MAEFQFIIPDVVDGGSHPAFEEATLLLPGKDSVAGQRLTSGNLLLGRDIATNSPFPIGTTTTFIQSRDYLITIGEDNSIQRLCTDKLAPDYGRNDEAGYLISSSLRTGETCQVVISDRRYAHTIGEVTEVTDLTDFPIEEVFVVKN